MIRERCACGAELEASRVKWWLAWRATHQCLVPAEERDSSGFAQVERTEDVTAPELHIGFRYEGE